MRKTNNFTVLAIFFLLLACSSPGSRISSRQNFKTDYGFTFKVPFEGDWYQMRGPHYVFGSKPEEDGSTVLAEEKHGFVYPTEEELIVKRETLKKFFEPNLRMQDPDQRVQISTTDVTYKTFKKTECLFFKQIGFDTDESMGMTYNGMICLLPSNGNRYVWLSVSQRVPKGKAFKDLSSEETRYFESLEFQ
jgi:hypothetical protein